PAASATRAFRHIPCAIPYTAPAPSPASSADTTFTASHPPPAARTAASSSTYPGMYTNSGSSSPWATTCAADSRYMAKSPTGFVGITSTQARRSAVARATTRTAGTMPGGSYVIVEVDHGVEPQQQALVLRPPTDRRAHARLRPAPVGRLGAAR